jgi:hypothetical protein
MKSQTVALVLFAIWTAVALVFFSAGSEVDRSRIFLKRGQIVSAVCVDRPKRHLLEVRVKYDGQEAPVRDAFSLERNIRCTREFMRQIANGSVQVSYYKNRYLGISIEGMQIKSEESEIQDIESGWAFNVLSLVIAGPISFVLLARSLRNR